MTYKCFLVGTPNVSLFLFFLFFTPAFSQEKIRIDENTHRIVKSPWDIQSPETQSNFRGLHVINDKLMWASGSGGTILNTFDGGKHWRILKIKGAENLDIRDIHAIDEGTVIAMTVGTPARIYRTTNAGLSWKMVFESKDPQVFLDSISFFNSSVGIAMCDPIDDRLLVLRTFDRGLTWKSVSKTPATRPHEKGFAASGSNMATVGKNTVVIGLGGGELHLSTRSRVVYSEDNLRSWKESPVPLPRSETAGIFSVCFANDKAGVIVGGDYKKTDATPGNFAVSRDGGRTWFVPKKTPAAFGLSKLRFDLGQRERNQFRHRRTQWHRSVDRFGEHLDPNFQ